MEVFHFQAGTKEYHHFLVSVLSKEGEQQQESFLRRTDNVTLKQQLKHTVLKHLQTAEPYNVKQKHKVLKTPINKTSINVHSNFIVAAII